MQVVSKNCAWLAIIGESEATNNANKDTQMTLKHFKVDLTRKISADFLRKAWRQIAIATHPDKGGSAIAFREAKAEYDWLLIRANAFWSAEDDSPETYGNDWDEFLANVSEVVREACSKIRPVAESLGVTMTISGTWVWIANTKPEMAPALKEVGLKWASQKKEWFFNGERWYGHRMTKEEREETFGAHRWSGSKRLAIR